MKVVGINGSARADGNTAIMIERVFAELQRSGIDTELIQLAGKTIAPCRACWACGGRGGCVHNGDAFTEIFEKLKQADGIVLGSPAYSANISSTMQAMLERAAVICDMNPGLFARKVGVSLSAARRGGALQAVDAMNHFFLNHEMYIAGSTYWSIAYGQQPGDVLKDEEGMATMKNLGQSMAYLLQATASPRPAGQI